MNYLHRGIIAGIAGASVVMLPMPAASNWGATVVKRSDGQGNTQTIIMSEQHARIETPDPNYYMLIDLGKGKVYQVNAKEKRIIEMDIIGTPPKPPRERRGGFGQMERGGPPQDRWGRGGPPRDRGERHGPPQDQWGRGGPPRNRGERHGPRGIPQSWKRSVKAELVDKGRGPNIAGYSTVKYRMKANGKVCAETYFSQEAAEVPYIKAFIKAMSQMSNSRKPKLKGMPLPPCMKAHEQLEAKLMKLGVPMKTVLKGGKRGEMVRDKITSIRTGVDIPDESFTLPGYKTMSEQEAMEEGWKQMKKRMEEAKQRRRDERPYQQRWREDDERHRQRPYQQRWREDDERRSERPYQRRWREDDERRDEQPHRPWR
jgi:hypothetical protein